MPGSLVGDRHMRDLEAGAERAEVARLWSRAIDPQGVVVAMAPLQAEGATARATLAVGAGFDLAGTFVEITAKPTLAPASAALRGLRRAHEHAHVALRAERLSHFEPAAASWRLSAGSWAELDDVADQAAALHFAARDLGLAGLTTDADALAARARQLGATRGGASRARGAVPGRGAAGSGPSVNEAPESGRGES